MKCQVQTQLKLASIFRSVCVSGTIYKIDSTKLLQVDIRKPKGRNDFKQNNRNNFYWYGVEVAANKSSSITFNLNIAP